MKAEIDVPDNIVKMFEGKIDECHGSLRPRAIVLSLLTLAISEYDQPPEFTAWIDKEYEKLRQRNVALMSVK